MSITTGAIFDPEILNSLREIKEKGDANAEEEEYIDKVIAKGKIPVSKTIPPHKFYIFRKDQKSVSQGKKAGL